MHNYILCSIKVTMIIRDTFTDKTNISKGNNSSGNEWSHAFWHLRYFSILPSKTFWMICCRMLWHSLTRDTPVDSGGGGGGRQAMEFIWGGNIFLRFLNKPLYRKRNFGGWKYFFENYKVPLPRINWCVPNCFWQLV